ncbi:MAG: PHP domain-containing protein [Synergistaceae bacterium]|nr:PHP domain-containing protein [Synergistaceae bacterium]
MPSQIDLHLHSNASDGTDSPEEILEKVKALGLKVFALTDHDTITGALKLKDLVKKNSDLKFIPGIEFSCRTEKNKCHILGLNYNHEHPAFKEILAAGNNLRHEKFFKRIDFLRDRFNITFTAQEIEDLLKIPSTGKPHLANLLISKGLAKTRPEAIENFIDKAKTGNDKVNAADAIKAVKNSGGISVWAHPLGGERESELSEKDFYFLLDELISYGLQGLECYYSKYDFQKCQWLEQIAKQKNLFISGGSDSHGANKNIPIGKLNAENIFVESNLLTVLENF